MKWTPIVCLQCLLLFEAPLFGQQTAKVNLVCLSLRFQPTTVSAAGTRYSMDLMSLSGLVAANRELRPDFYDSVGDFNKIIGFYRIHASIYPVAPEDDFIVNLPPFADLNRDGLHDFYDVSQAVANLTTTGVIEDTVGGQGDVTVTWNRAANSTTGLCQIHMRCDYLRLDVTFPTVFELVTYTGTLRYTPGSADVAGSVTLTEAGQPTNVLTGPVQFTKAGTDLLTASSGSWTNSAGKKLAFNWKLPVTTEPSLIERFGTNYFGLLSFEDGGLDTTWPDYLVWAMSISDPNDFDRNGIPDLSDLTAPPRRPTLAVNRSNDQLLFRVAGEIGKNYVIQQTTDLSLGIWASAFSLVLTSDPQVFPQPIPTTPTSFWRMKKSE